MARRTGLAMIHCAFPIRSLHVGKTFSLGAQRARMIAATQKASSRELLGGKLDTATVLRVFLKSAKDAAAPRQGGKELASPFGGALDTATVLRVFL